MKTLILNGFPRINGDTRSLINFRKEEPITKSKKGAVILVGGGDGHIDTAYSTACTLLHHMNSYNIHDVVYSHNTNEIPAINDKNVLLELNNLLEFFK